jgi:hypothetical protein
MRLFVIICGIYVSAILGGCATGSNISGRYTNVFAGIAGEEFTFNHASGTFVYYSRTEGSINNYSTGSWTQNNNTVIINGFNENIKTLDVISNIGYQQNNSADQIEIRYNSDPLENALRVDVIINKAITIGIHGDTAFFTNTPIKTLQVKSYLALNRALPAARPRIDTLVSREIEVANPGEQKKKVSLKFDVSFKDFYRYKLTDTLTVKNNRTLIWDKRQFKKVISR